MQESHSDDLPAQNSHNTNRNIHKCGFEKHEGTDTEPRKRSGCGNRGMPESEAAGLVGKTQHVAHGIGDLAIGRGKSK